MESLMINHMMEIVDKYCSQFIKKQDPADLKTWLFDTGSFRVSYLSIFNGCVPYTSNFFYALSEAKAMITFEEYRKFISLQDHEKGTYKHLIRNINECDVEGN